MTEVATCDEISFESRLTERGYRAVMLRVSLMRLRWVLPFAAFFIFNELGRGDTRTALVLAGMTAGTVMTIVLYANWASGSPSQRAVYDPVHYRTAEEGLVFEAGERSGIVEWGTVRRWVFVHGHFLLYVGSSSYLLVPADALESVVCDGDKAEQGPAHFETILRDHVARSPRHRFY
ncbi:MAG: YcxB family protein [Actinomycetota bacterium]|nr:YcxB family protein [Actinomycetota bacterium]